ncbi:MAG: ankyrin repeat domain-containing protein [Gammaproteobacteria bacterium]
MGSDTDDTPEVGIAETELDSPSFLEDLAKKRDPNISFVGWASVSHLGYMKTAYEDGADVNARNAETGATALHYAASMHGREIINWLAKRENIDYLIQDNEGRLPSALAYEIADDPVIGRFLVKKQNEQARARGIDISKLLTP